MSFAVLRFLFTAGVFLAGVLIAWLYLREPPVPKSEKARMLVGMRPWRRLGGAICLVLAVMFVLGVYVVDVPDHPRVYAAYWTVMMGLVLWLCGLAIKDVRHTRAAVARWHKQRRELAESLRVLHSAPKEQES